MVEVEVELEELVKVGRKKDSNYSLLSLTKSIEGEGEVSQGILVMKVQFVNGVSSLVEEFEELEVFEERTAAEQAGDSMMMISGEVVEVVGKVNGKGKRGDEDRCEREEEICRSKLEVEVEVAEGKDANAESVASECTVNAVVAVADSTESESASESENANENENCILLLLLPAVSTCDGVVVDGGGGGGGCCCNYY